MTKCCKKNRRKCCENLSKPAATKSSLCTKLWSKNRILSLAGKYLSSYCPPLMVCIVGHYVIRHKARGECQERWELFPFPVSKDTFYLYQDQENNNMTRFSTFPVRSSHSCKSKAYWLHCPQTGNPLMSPGLAALKNTFPQTICICKEKINISV